jgi:hypothetical protein
MADVLKNIFGGAKPEQPAAAKPDSGTFSASLFAPLTLFQSLAFAPVPLVALTSHAMPRENS